MIVFLDLKASSLGADSHPIEIGWCSEDGTATSYLIRPEGDWLDWSVLSASMHGISLETLAAEGRWASEVASVAASAPNGTVVSDAPDADRFWLQRLTDVAGLPPITVGHVYDAYDAVLKPLRTRMPGSLAHSMAQSFLKQAEQEASRAEPERHRAAADARRLWRTWSSLRLLVADALDGWPTS